MYSQLTPNRRWRCEGKADATLPRSENTEADCRRTLEEEIVLGAERIEYHIDQARVHGIEELHHRRSAGAACAFMPWLQRCALRGLYRHLSAALARARAIWGRSTSAGESQRSPVLDCDQGAAIIESRR